MDQELIRKIEHYINEKQLFAPGEKIVAAVSGGPDSVALLHILHRIKVRYGWSLSAAHVNHGLRGEESDEDEAYVERLCAELDIPFLVRRVQVKSQLDLYGRNVQAAARALRFQSLHEMAQAQGTTTVALGHHGDDQAETVLMRLLRGTSPGGLGGIRPTAYVNGMKLARPLLAVTKRELEQYIEIQGIEARFDSSNASRKYFRNVIRLDILPYLLKHQSGAAESLRRIAEMSAAEDDYLDAAAEERAAGIVQIEDGIVYAEREQFASAHIALQRRMIKIILNRLNLADEGIDFGKIERIREAIVADEPTTISLRVHETVEFRRIYDRLEWAPAEESEPEPYVLELDVSRDGSIELPGGMNARLEWKRIVLPKGERFSPIQNDSYSAWFDAEALGADCIVRSRRPGDRIATIGLNGTQKVKDMFIDGKLPRRRRDSWPLVTDRSGELLWVPGFRRSRGALVTGSTEVALVMTMRIGDNNMT